MSSPQYPYPPQPPQPSYSVPPPAPQGSNLKTALGAGAIAASLAANVFLLFQVRDLQTLTAKNQEVVQNQIETIKESSTVMTASQKKRLEELRDDLDTRSRQLNAAASQAKKEAVSYADEQAKKLEQENQKTKQEVAQTNTALSDVRQKADSATARLADVGTDVAGVKTDLASTKTDLDKTKSELKKVSGDLGITNGYVATSAKDIDELRRRGEVSIIEFSLKKQKTMQRVGDISMQLEKSDAKKNRFNVILLADDKRVEKKDRTVNEPLQFYVSKSLYQIVVLSVGKDQISGYLQTPKYMSR
jgi:chromosome segregation ATPase